MWLEIITMLGRLQPGRLVSVHSVMLKLDPTTGSGKWNRFDIRLNCLAATMTTNCSEEEVITFVFSINYLDPK